MKVRRRRRRKNNAYANLQWEKGFSELSEFKKKYGHCYVPRKNKKYSALARWCSQQRTLKKSGVLKVYPDRIHNLNKLGFCWHLYEKRFDYNFLLLKQYQEKYGHCNVPCTNNNQSPIYSLERWVRRQRGYYHSKSNYLTADRIAKLNSIGFCWINPLKRGVGRGINDNDLLDELRRLYVLRGIPPSDAYIDEHGKYSGFTYANHFGSMTKARIAAGINSAITRKKYSDSQMLDDLWHLANSLGRIPKFIDIKKYVKYSPALYYHRFGSIAKAIKAAGIDSVISK